MNLKDLIFGGGVKSGGDGGTYRDSIQAWLPIKNIIGGVVITKDGRFVKILELLPVNIYLKSPNDRQNIISSFAAYTIVAKDRPKNKKSYRTLPLVPEYRRLLLQMKKHQEEYRELCGNCYHESDYIYVNDIGEQIKPNYVTQHFKLVLRKNNLREITFHELRHTCASLLLKSGISMKDIQAWLGHSNYNTTANIYAHLESNSKELTGNAMQGNLTISGNLAAMQE